MIIFDVQINWKIFFESIETHFSAFLLNVKYLSISKGIFQVRSSICVNMPV